MEKKGTVTSLSSLFPADEARQASKRVLDTIDERQKQLDQVKGFLDENTSLVNLVRKLPDDTHHNIMVPFGKAAFFPGRLIHTNEFMVLLGEGYYAERTSKQTTEILKRRGAGLETQVESLKAMMQDLKVEASFFETTAQESAEGLVEIREDYVEEGSAETIATAYKESASTVDDIKAADEDEEFARILARMAELEEEEEEAEKANESDEDEETQNELVGSTNQNSINQEVRSSQVEASEVPAVSESNSHPEKYGSSNENRPAPSISMLNKAVEVPVQEKEVVAPFTVNKAVEVPVQEKEVVAPFPVNNPDIIGSIVERDHNIGKILPVQQPVPRTTRPVSRFKMQSSSERK